MATMTKIDKFLVITDGIDFVASEMEKKWGVGRLRLLVNDELREKFDHQHKKFNAALYLNDYEQTKIHGQAMKRAWEALDKAAMLAGKHTLSPQVWEARRTDGKVMAIVRTNEDAHAVVTDGRFVEVWTIEEFARLINGSWNQIGKAKEVFPGATVLNYTDSELLDDKIPF